MLLILNFCIYIFVLKFYLNYFVKTAISSAPKIYTSCYGSDKAKYLLHGNSVEENTALVCESTLI